MATVRRQVIIDRDVDAVWSVVGDPATIADWFPGMASAEMGTSDEGVTRLITTDSGIPIPELVVTNDPIQRRFQYRVTAPFMTQHLGTIDGFDLGDGRTLVSYATDAEPDAMALMIGGATGAALRNLKQHVEDGQERRSRA